jgi:hypothetical protein
MASRLSSLASSLSFAHFLGLPEKQAKEHEAKRGRLSEFVRNHPSIKNGSNSKADFPATDPREIAIQRVDQAALTEATAAAVAEERVRWSEIMAVGLSVGTAAHALHLAKGGMSARDAISTLQKAKANKDSLKPPEKTPLTGWLAAKAKQEADPNHKTPMQRREERLRWYEAQEQSK